MSEILTYGEPLCVYLGSLLISMKAMMLTSLSRQVPKCSVFIEGHLEKGIPFIIDKMV